MSLTVGSLFAGIGGLDLGLERAGMEVKWQVEIDPFCRRVLAKHWPEVKRHEDVREVGKDELEDVDLICGGFPCQDVSAVGGRGGISGERSVLWKEYARVLGDLRPRYAVVENTAGLFDRGFGQVLGDLAALGYDAEWSVLSACSLGAPHSRERVFYVAYHDGKRQEAGWPERGRDDQEEASGRAGAKHVHQAAESGGRKGGAHWSREPNVGRVADGVPNRVDRLRGLGNAVVPQVAEWIGRRIVEAHQAMEEAA